VTKVGDTSGVGTRFTTTAITDGSAWDLSAVSVGEVAVTSDGYKGIITAVSDGLDTLTIKGGWMPPSGRAPNPVTGIKPADGSTVTIHRISRLKSLTIQSLDSNVVTIYVGRHGTATALDLALAPGEFVVLRPDGVEYLDVTEVYVLAASGSRTVAYAAGGGRRT